jgi:hypothetical protein
VERTDNPKARPLIFVAAIALAVACACTIIVVSLGLFEPVYEVMQRAGLLPTGAPDLSGIATPTRAGVDGVAVPTITVPAPSGTSTPTPEPVILYVCGYERCRDSAQYGELLHPTGIEVWANPDPDRGEVRSTIDHQRQVAATRSRRVSDGPGGLWYALGGDGWISDLWVTEQPCVADNLEQYSFASCQAGQY